MKENREKVQLNLIPGVTNIKRLVCYRLRPQVYVGRMAVLVKMLGVFYLFL